MLLANICVVVVLVVAPSTEAKEKCFHPSAHIGLKTGELIISADTWVGYVDGLEEDAKAYNISAEEGPLEDIDERRQEIVRLRQEIVRRYKVDAGGRGTLLHGRNRRQAGFFTTIFNFFKIGGKVVPPIVAKVPRTLPRVNSAPNIGAAVYPSLGSLARTTSLDALRSSSAPLRFAGDSFVRPLARESFKRQVIDYIVNNKFKVAGAVGGAAGTAVTIWQIISNTQLANDVAASNKPIADLASANQDTIGEINELLAEIIKDKNDDKALDKLGFGMLGLALRGDTIIARLKETLGLIIDSSNGFIPPSPLYVNFFNEILKKIPPNPMYKPHTEGSPASLIDYLDTVRVFDPHRCVRAVAKRDADSQNHVYEAHSPYYQFHLARNRNLTSEADQNQTAESATSPRLTFPLPNYIERRVPSPYKPIEAGKKPMNFTPISTEPYQRFQENIANHAPSIGISVAASVACGLFAFIVCSLIRKAIKERWGRGGSSGGSANFASPGTVVAIVPPTHAAVQSQKHAPLAPLDSVTLEKLEHLLQVGNQQLI